MFLPLPKWLKWRELFARANLRWLCCNGNKNLFPRVLLLPTWCDNDNNNENDNDNDEDHCNHCEDGDEYQLHAPVGAWQRSCAEDHG